MCAAAQTTLIRPVALDDIDGHDVLLQTGFWGRFKSCFGWTPLAFALGGELPFLALVRTIGAGRSICYVPHGPIVGSTANRNEYYLTCVSEELERYLPSGCVFIRYDLPWGVAGEGTMPLPLRSPFRRAPMDIQPASTVLVDLSTSETEMLERMKPKTRYNIRLAEKKGVIVSLGTPADVPAWYELYKVTAARDRIAIHSLVYYRKLFELAETKPAAIGRAEARENWLFEPPPFDSPAKVAPSAPPLPEILLLTAAVEGETLAGIIVAVHGTSATYLFGASSNSKRNLMPTYLLQWEAMRLVKARGCLRYDLFGIPFSDDEADPMHGLFRFKTGFGGAVVNRPGSWDYPLAGASYALYRRAETLRRWYYKRFKKRNGTAAGG